MRDAMDLLLNRLAKVIRNLSSFAIKWKGELSGFLSSPAVGTLALFHLCSTFLALVMWIGDTPPHGLIQAPPGFHSTGESDRLWLVFGLVIA